MRTTNLENGNRFPSVTNSSIGLGEAPGAPTDVGHPHPGDPTRWISPYKVKHAEDRTTNGCPIPRCPSLCSNAASLIKHLRTRHRKGSGPRTRDDTRALNEKLGEIGAWFCWDHHSYNGLVNGSRAARTGLHTYRYKPCSGCGPTFRPEFKPLPASSFIIPPAAPTRAHADATIADDHDGPATGTETPLTAPRGGSTTSPVARTADAADGADAPRTAAEAYGTPARPPHATLLPATPAARAAALGQTQATPTGAPGNSATPGNGTTSPPVTPAALRSPPASPAATTVDTLQAQEKLTQAEGSNGAGAGPTSRPTAHAEPTTGPTVHARDTHSDTSSSRSASPAFVRPAPPLLLRALGPAEGRVFATAMRDAQRGVAPFGATAAFGTPMTPSDFKSLGHGEQLTDAPIGAMANFLNATSPSVRALDPQFYPTLTAPSGYDYERVRRWFRDDRRHVGHRDYLLVPLHQPGHWTLAVIDLRCRTILHYDPMGPREDADERCKVLRRWLADEVREKSGRSPTPPRLADIPTWQIVTADANWPRQHDSVSCGLFVITVMTCIAQGTPPRFTQSDVPHIRKVLLSVLLNGAATPPVANAAPLPRPRTGRAAGSQQRRRSPRSRRRPTTSQDPVKSELPARTESAARPRAADNGDGARVKTPSPKAEMNAVPPAGSNHPPTPARPPRTARVTRPRAKARGAKTSSAAASARPAERTRHTRTPDEIEAGVPTGWRARAAATAATVAARAKQPGRSQSPRPASNRGERRLGRGASANHPPLEEIFITRIPLLMHIPVFERPRVRDAFINALRDVDLSSSDAELRHAFACLFVFTQCILFVPPATDSDTPSLGKTVRARLARWQQGDIMGLWTAAKSAAATRSPPTQPDPNTHKQARALRLAREGAYNKAITALFSNGAHPLTDAVKQTLLDKHPQQRAPADPRFERPTTGVFPKPPPHKPFSTLEVQDALNGSAPATAAGGSALAFQHLKEMVRTDGTDELKSLSKALATLADRVATGKLPAPLAAWFASAPVSPLRKRDEGVRPVAVGETLRRMVGKMLMRRARGRAAALLGPTQLGVGVRCGAEAIVHAVRHRVRESGQDSRLALLKLDFRNAFNVINRNAMLRAVRTHLPELEPYFRLCYMQSEDPHLWCDSLRMRSAAGCQQGDPLGPLFFSLALYDLLSEMPPPPPSAVDDDTDTSATGHRALFYIDDGVVIGPHATLQHYLTYLASPTAVAYGVHLRADKCTVWWPTAPPQECQDAYPRNVQQEYTEGTTVMQAPIGADTYVRQALLAQIADTRPLFDSIAAMEDAHVSFTLLRSCLSSCRVNFLLRVTPTPLIEPAAKLFDSYLAGSVRQLIGGVLPDSTVPELQLPVRTDTPSFGIGLTSATAIASAAYIASLSSSRWLLEQLTPSPSQTSLVDHADAIAAHRDWVSRVHGDDVLPLEELMRDGAPPQRELSRRVHKHTADNLPQGDLRRRAHRASLGVVGAKDWLLCRPSPGLHTHIADRDFRLWLRHFCGVRLFNDEFPCPRERCPETVDAHGDHLLVCHHRVSLGNSPLHWRHDSIVHVLAACLKRASRNPVIEPRGDWTQDRKRPDIRTDGTSGGTDYLDITISHPLTSVARMSNIEKYPRSVLTSANTRKRATYHDFIANAGTDAHIQPVAITSLGGWHEEARKYFERVCDSIAARTRSPRRYVTDIVFGRAAAQLLRLNCRSLTEGVMILP